MKETKWENVPIDTKILVRDKETQRWTKGYFAGYKLGKVYTWSNGSTSWSNNERNGYRTVGWEYAEVAK